MRETSEEKIRERRENLIRAADAHPNPEFEPLLEKSNADDLDWLLLRLNTQIAETHRRADDPEESSAKRARRRANRNAVGEALRKRRITDLQEMKRSATIKKVIPIIGLVIAFFALLIGFFALLVNIFK